MRIEEVAEGVTQIWGRNKGKIVRKYRCTSGSRKGRIVSKPTTCTAPKRVKSSISIKKAKARRGGLIKQKTAVRKRHGTSRRVTRMNKPRSRAGKRKIR